MEDDRVALALERLAAASERQAEASEHLNALAASEALSEPPAADVEMFDLPACPGCGALDPPTRIMSGEGRLSEFVMITPCGECGRVFYAIPLGWRIVADKQVARQMLSTKNGLLKGHST